MVGPIVNFVLGKLEPLPFVTTNFEMLICILKFYIIIKKIVN